ncbi:MAG TPA: Ig-like domain-containing protein [Patescibacteria group bacterium]
MDSLNEKDKPVLSNSAQEVRKEAAGSSQEPLSDDQTNKPTNTMTAKGKRSGRLLKREEQEVYRRLIIVLAGIIFIIFFTIFFGVQILVKFAEFLDLFRGDRPPETASDITPPFIPRIDTPFTATNTAKFKLSGFAEAGSKVEIYQNGQVVKDVLADNNGTFEVEEFILKDGENKIEAKSTDIAGNASQISTAGFITYDNSKPILQIDQPADHETFFGSKRDIKVTGKAEEGSTVTINGFWAIVNPGGNFTYNLVLGEGENVINVEAVDAAGNKVRQTRVVYYIK